MKNIRLENFTDEELIILLKDGNRKAFDEIYERYWKKLFLSAFKRTRSQEDSQDMVQDLFISLWQKREVIEIKQSLSAYLFSSIKYKVINYVQSHVVRESYINTLKKTAQDYDDSTQGKIFSDDLTTMIESGMNSLSPKVREVFELSRNENLSIKEIAEKLNVSDQTVKNQISKALKTLKLHLNHFLSFLLFFLANL